MAIKDLALAYDGSPAAHSALEFAVQMAKKYGAEITGVHVHSPAKISADFKRWISQDVLENIEESARHKVDEIEKEVRGRVSALEFNGPVHWAVEIGNHGIMLARKGRYFDILLTGQFARPNTPQQAPKHPEHQNHTKRNPQKNEPERKNPPPNKQTAAVAWDGSRSAARALSDSMQILETKQKLDILVVEGKKSHEDPYAPLPAAEIITHLGRHGVAAKEVRLEPGGQSPADAVLEYCGEADPDVLVMGAFGRGKLGAMLFGSMTTKVLASMNVPVLVSH